MIVSTAGVRVLLATQPADFRKGMDGLAAHVEVAFDLGPTAARSLPFARRVGTGSRS